MDRRQFLALSGTALSALVAGCSTLQFGATDRQREFAIGVYNLSQESHSFEVLVGERPGEFFHRETVELDANTADEEIPFDGVPGSLLIRVDSETEREFPWPAEHGGSEEIARKANIYYDPIGDQQLLVQAE